MHEYQKQKPQELSICEGCPYLGTNDCLNCRYETEQKGMESPRARLTKYILSFIIGSILAAGCITNHYYCNCGTDCQCQQGNSLKDDSGPVVSPEKINTSSEDGNAPQMHKDKPWYIN